MRDPELLRGHGLFIAEGRLVVQRLLEGSPLRARSVLVTPTARDSLASTLDRADCPIYVVDRATMAAVAGFDIHRGCLALGERPEPVGLDDFLRTAGAGPLIVLERVGNPDNVGGIFRNAAALGASGVVLSPGCSDPLYRKSIRTSMGASLHVPFCVAERWPDAIDTIALAGRTVVALTPRADAERIDEVAARLSGTPVALLLGHEGSGLSAEAASRATVHARIPLVAGTDSLNVASASAVALHLFGSEVNIHHGGTEASGRCPLWILIANVGRGRSV